MYRCALCDAPSQFGCSHDEEDYEVLGSVDMMCPIERFRCCPDDETCCRGGSGRINIASGEDVVLT